MSNDILLLSFQAPDTNLVFTENPVFHNPYVDWIIRRLET